jgi:hypothetical protein
MAHAQTLVGNSGIKRCPSSGLNRFLVTISELKSPKRDSQIRVYASAAMPSTVASRFERYKRTNKGLKI